VSLFECNTMLHPKLGYHFSVRLIL